MKFIVASKNKNKIKELNRILIPLGIEAVCENDIGLCLPEVEETGTTFIDNARLKAASACEASGMPAIADDSGVCVDKLGGAPGVYSARYAGSECDTAKNNAKLLSELEGVPENERSAHFACAICVIFPNGDEIMCEGRCDGKIGFEPMGQGGFGYDPLFFVGDKSFAELSEQEKDKISHRGNALRILSEKLKEYFNVNK